MINHKDVEKALYELCVQANTELNDSVFEKILYAYNNEENKDSKQALKLILKNAKMAYLLKKPLCQDTGQVLVFLKIGEKTQVENLYKSINTGVEKAYKELFFRKSVVKNALFDRTNTQTNTPCIIYTEIVDGENLEIEILIKGAGAENASATKMLSPTSSEEDIIKFAVDTVKLAGSKACPPMFIGIGIGGTLEYSGLLSKKALISDSGIDNQHKSLTDKIKTEINKLKIGTAGLEGDFTALDVKILTDMTHIASMPVTVTINCHSSRHAKCLLSKDKIKFYPQSKIKEYSPLLEDFSDYIKVNTNETDKIKLLTKGQKLLLSGEIYTARDMAHKNLVELINNNAKLPFDLKNQIIFYAGPCPCAENDIIGSIGPTTSSRMDKFMPTLIKSGILGTIGKGERSKEVIELSEKYQVKNFNAIGGIACYLSTTVIKKEIIAFEELGTEAILKLTVKDLPLTLS